MTAPITALTATLGRRPDMLAEAARSVRGQTLQPLEHIVVDDGSFSVAPMEGVTLLSIEHAGLGPARNAGLASARGDAVALLDDDDLWHPHHLATLWEQMRMTGADVVYSDCLEVGRRDGYATRVADFDFELLQRENFICVPATLVRTSALLAVGGFSSGALEDWQTWKRMAAAGARFVHVPEVTVTYRFHEDNLTYGGVDPAQTRAVKQLLDAAQRGEISWEDYQAQLGEVWR
ncbi:MAG TPA: glycosyltransferase [Mycobacteriales bacterium]|nr:glycosyltransferase [Mycobacteriales bacterium]